MSKNLNKISPIEEFPDWILKKWQEIANLLSEIIGIPAVLIMKTENEYMEVLITSKSEDNPYHVGEKEKWDGLYCETVIKTQSKLLISNATKNKIWDKNPDIKLGMIAYLGFPLNFPDNQPFGTLCVLDNKERHFTIQNEKLIQQFKNVIELDLALIQSFEIQKGHLTTTNEKEITESNQAKTNFVELILSYSQIINSVLEGIIVYDQNLKIQVWNLFMEKLTGLPASEVIGKLPLDVFPFLKEAGVIYNLEKALNGEISDEVDFPFSISTTGRTGWASDTPAPLYNTKNEIIGVISTVTDITQRKHSEMILQESEQMFRSIFENNSAAMAVIEPDATISLVNEEYCKISGYMPQEIIGTSWTEQIPPEDLERFKEYISRRMINPDEVPDKYDFKYYNKNRQLKNALMSVTVLSNKKLIASFVDITQRLQAEKMLAYEKQRLENIIEGTNVGTWEWNIQTGETVFNELWANFIGYTLEEISPLNIDTWTKYSHPEDLKISVELLEKHFKGELSYYECESRMKHKNGDWIWVLDRGKVHKWDEKGRPLLMSGTHSDITERKKSEKALKVSEERLRQLNADKDKFFSIVAHDLRSPFNTFLGYTKMMAEEMDSMSITDLQKIAALLSKSAKGLYNLLDNLLHWTRMEQGLIPFKPKNIILADIYNDIVEVFLSNAEAKNITIHHLITNDLVVFADIDMLKTVLRNLVSNAIKFTNNGGAINISASHTTSSATISVSDNGVGIAPASIKILFDVGQVQTTKGTENETG